MFRKIKEQKLNELRENEQKLNDELWELIGIDNKKYWEKRLEKEEIQLQIIRMKRR